MAAAASASAPPLASLRAVYAPAQLALASARYAAVQTLVSAMASAGEQKARAAVARAPGRANIIGEHIDYEGYEVFPMAIALDAIVAARSVPEGHGEGGIAFANVDAAKYPSGRFATTDVDQPMPEKHGWSSYLLAAYKGVAELFASHGLPFKPVPLQLVVSGTVPPGSGLSSSSALCCAAMLAISAVLIDDASLLPSKTAFADAACKAERHVGVMSGGMDQTVSLCAKRNFASLVSFVPSISTKDVPLPDDAVFIVGNSLAVSNKALTNASKYNLRVVECRLAALVVAKKLGVAEDVADLADIKTLRDVEPHLVRHAATGGGGGDTSVLAPLNDHDEAEMEDDELHCPAAVAARELLHPEPYTQAELEALLNAKLADVFDNREAALITFEPAAKLNGGFKLLHRTLHVYREKARVHRMAAACIEASKASTPPAKRPRSQDILEPLGKLMSSSHESCARLYECSCPELDRLVEAMEAAGALGARLTGAGWGGCAIGLFRKSTASSALEKIRNSYYVPKFEQARGKDKSSLASWMDDVCFETAPCSGAALLSEEGV